eukprot:g1136.t1
MMRRAITLAALGTAAALMNGLAVTPPMGFNSYMSGVSGEAGLGAVADFFISSGMHHSGYEYVNTDEGWENKARNASTGELEWSSSAYPSGLPTFIASLHKRGLKYGIYGAASGVTCGRNAGQLYYEDVDARTYARWGVDFLKSDNCASYALDSSVRFGAMRDALNRTGRPMLLSIEPFSIRPDPEQGPKVSNMWRIGTDISCRWDDILDRADISDKWAPLAGPGGWNDPDMINLNSAKLSAAENRVYFALWAVMKAPLLLSSDLPKLDASLIALANNTELIAVNQDPLGVQARKLVVDGAPLPWLVATAPCAGAAPPHSRNDGFPGAATDDNRAWRVSPAPVPAPLAAAVPAAVTSAPSAPAAAGPFTIENAATGRCLALAPDWNVSAAARPANQGRVVLLPCQPADTAQQWRFDMGAHTVTSVTSVQAGLALAVANATLFSEAHGVDARNVTDAAYGDDALELVAPYNQADCTDRDCQNYDDTQMWYYSPTERLLRHATFTASINHKQDGAGYTLTKKMPTWRHHCLSHVLSVANAGTAPGETEVWGGPLAGGAYVLAAVNRGAASAAVRADFAALGAAGVGAASVFRVRELLSHSDLGTLKGGLDAAVPSHDIKVYKLTPP